MSNFKPYPFQTEAMYAVLNYFEQNSTGHPLCCLPTGTGKGSLIAMLIDYILFNWPNQRILQLVHTKELVRQNYDDLLNLNELAPAGIYCAGLDRKETANSVVFGSLGSVRNNVEAFGHRDLVIVDEAHSISPVPDILTIVTGRFSVLTRFSMPVSPMQPDNKQMQPTVAIKIDFRTIPPF